MAQSRQALLRSYLFVGGVILIAVILVYTGRLARKMEEEAQATSFLFAQFAANLPDQDPRVRERYRDVIAEIHFPLILTDREGRPRVWRHIGVELDAVTDYELTHYDLDDPPTSGPLGDVIRRLGELDEQNQPIPIMAIEGDREFGRVHYGRSTLVRELRLFPLLELSIVVIFIFLAVLGYRGIKDSEQRSVWVGMAKETAHQLGTPISSLMGWLEVLRDKIGDGDGEGASVHVDREFLDDVIREMENDTARLEKIAARFSNVGSVPRLTEQDIVPVVAEAARYLRRRLPHMGVKVQIHEQFEEAPKVNVNRELIEWVVENLLKNALDSVDRQTGEITLQVKRDAPTESVDVRVHDNGRGMTPAEQRQVFEPGFSTKRRGWGLGLSLSRRIIEEYHGGRIFLESSVPGEGTVFVIRFPL